MGCTHFRLVAGALILLLSGVAASQPPTALAEDLWNLSQPSAEVGDVITRLRAKPIPAAELRAGVLGWLQRGPMPDPTMCWLLLEIAAEEEGAAADLEFASEWNRIRATDGDGCVTKPKVSDDAALLYLQLAWLSKRFDIGGRFARFSDCPQEALIRAAASPLVAVRGLTAMACGEFWRFEWARALALQLVEEEQPAIAAGLVYCVSFGWREVGAPANWRRFERVLLAGLDADDVSLARHSALALGALGADASPLLVERAVSRFLRDDYSASLLSVGVLPRLNVPLQQRAAVVRHALSLAADPQVLGIYLPAVADFATEVELPRLVVMLDAAAALWKPEPGGLHWESVEFGATVAAIVRRMSAEARAGAIKALLTQSAPSDWRLVVGIELAADLDAAGRRALAASAGSSRSSLLRWLSVLADDAVAGPAVVAAPSAEVLFECGKLIVESTGWFSRHVLNVIAPHVPAATLRAWREAAVTNYALHCATESALDHHAWWSLLRK